MDGTESFRMALERVEEKKRILNIALENYALANAENIEFLKENSDKAFEELKKEYLFLMEELIAQVKA